MNRTKKADRCTEPLKMNSEQKGGLEPLQSIADRYQVMADHSPDLQYCCSCTGKLTAVNRMLCETVGMDAKDLIGRSVFRLAPTQKAQYIWKQFLKDMCINPSRVCFEFELESPEGEMRTYSNYLSPVLDSDGRLVEIAGTSHDITDFKRTESIIGRLAHYDSLTNLPNRVLFLDRLGIAIHHARRSNTKLAVIFLDLDNFKKINDTLGHFTGNEFIRIISGELTATLRKGETLARLSGDEFVISIQGIKSKENILAFIERVNKVFQSSYTIGQNDIHVSSSMGIAVFPDDGTSCEELINNADTAMYKAKELGKNNVQFYHISMRDEVFKRLAMEGYLGNALKNNEFRLCYQPLVDTYTGAIRGSEALLRWNSPKLGAVAPGDFIELAEETGMIVPIGEWVMRTACKMNHEWQTRYGCASIICVNVSCIQLKQPNFTGIVKDILNETGLGAEFLELEITESVLIDSFETIAKTLLELKAIGVKISLDDFGMGYSSLNYLKMLPLDTLKIDRSFIRDIGDRAVENEIVQTIISLVHKLNLEIVAEGVETKEQLVYIMDTRCDYMQGYLMCRPEEPAIVSALLKEGNIPLARILESSFESEFI